MDEDTAKRALERATNGERLPLWLVAAIAWHESTWDPEAVTGRHVGLFQLSPDVVDDWLRGGGEPGERTDPIWNAAVAGWALTNVAASLRKQLASFGFTLEWDELAPLVYWGWLAGTSDVPRLVWSYAKWLKELKRGKSYIPIVRLAEEIRDRVAAERQFADSTATKRWLPETIQRVLERKWVSPTLNKAFVYSPQKARHAQLVLAWANLRDWSGVEAFARKRGWRPGKVAAAAGGAAALLILLLLLSKRR